MKRIDFIGAPGSGKSTMYELLMRNRDRKWLTPEQAHRPVIAAYVSEEPSTRYRFKYALYKWSWPGSAVKENMRVSLIHDIGRHLVLERNWEEFISMLLGMIPQNIDIAGNRLWMVERLVFWVYSYLPVCMFPGDQKVCYDWSLSQRAIDREFFEITQKQENAESFFRLMPPPAGVVHVTASEETITRRILERFDHQKNPEHQSVSQDEIKARTKKSLDIAETGIHIMKQREIPVCTVDTESPNENTIPQVQAFIDRL